MNYNIEFQIASIIFISTLIIVFFSKRRWPTPANFVFRIVMILTFFTLVLDIMSVITITKVLAGETQYTLINNILSKVYLIVMTAYIVSVDIYVIANTIYQKISQQHLTWKYIEGIFFIICFVIGSIVIIMTPLLYGGTGKYIYSYGTPSNVVYTISTASVIFVIFVMFANLRKVPAKRFIPIIAFFSIQGIIALIQMYNKELLIVGLGTAVTCLVMYFSLENPDMNMIEELNNANRRSRDLILNILPVSIANKIEYNAEPVFQEYENSSVVCLRVSNFSEIASRLGEVKTAKTVNDFFNELDDLSRNYRISKVKTAANMYVAVSGIPEKYENNCEETIKFAQDIFKLQKSFNDKNRIELKLKVSINNGRLAAGTFGKKKFIYDLWGETLDFAQHLVLEGQVNKITVTDRVKNILGTRYDYEACDSMDLKGFEKTNIFTIR